MIDRNDLPAELADFPAVAKVPVQWGDMDSFQHVNNIVYLRWFETSRVRYLEVSGLNPIMEATDCGPILASVHCNYRKQLRYPDEVLIGARMVKLGGTSMKVEHVVYSVKQQHIVADGESGVVYFDYANQRPIVIPDEVRQLITKTEGREL
ncbi:acyl-CoA thioesterase [Bremerella sp. T1]|uniref:acyl-CoA thioesterase n=1 Tax=Bremerella sp. TYQ1 TaxID=3119568 RepID=UPI001CC917B9|nr:thioesterase family protein [Bremerella volcania]UBM35220.1 acyl-CoA thioesterase [Bremerella volcania]